MFYVHETEFGTKELTRRPKWFHDDGVPVSDEFLSDEGYFPVDAAFPFDKDRRIWDVLEKPIDQWEKAKGKYTKTYTVTKKDVNEVVELQKSSAHAALDQAREMNLREGFEWDFSGEKDFIQCGFQDIAALTPVHIRAQEKVAAGEGETLMNIRSKSNKVYEIPATEVVALTNAAFAYVEECFQATWAKKDQVDAIFAEAITGSKSLEDAIGEVDTIVGY